MRLLLPAARTIAVILSGVVLMANVDARQLVLRDLGVGTSHQPQDCRLVRFRPTGLRRLSRQ